MSFIFALRYNLDAHMRTMEDYITDLGSYVLASFYYKLASYICWLHVHCMFIAQ